MARIQGCTVLANCNTVTVVYMSHFLWLTCATHAHSRSKIFDDYIYRPLVSVVCARVKSLTKWSPTAGGKFAEPEVF